MESADRAAAVADAAEDRAELVTGDAARDWSDAPGETSIQVFEEFAGAAGRGVQAGRRRAADPLRLRVPRGHHDLPRLLDRPAVAPRPADRALRLHGKNAELTNSAWVGGATRDFSDVDGTRMAADLATRLSWGERRVDLPAGRYDTILPPSAVADLMIDAYWSAGARNADDGQTIFSRPGGGTRIGEQMVNPGVRLHSDPSYPGLECAPFVVAGGSSDRSSVYDNGAAPRPDRLDPRRPAHLADPDPAHRGPDGPADHPRDRQPGAGRRRGPPAPRPTSSPGWRTACC